MKKIIFSLIAFSFSLQAWGQATQFFLEDHFKPNLKVKIYAVGEAQAQAMIQEALYASVDAARELLNKIDPETSGSEINTLNKDQKSGKFLVSPELANILDEGLKFQKTTGHLIRMTSSDSPEAIRVSKKNNQIHISQEKTTLDPTPILYGFIADRIADHLDTAGWKNILVKINGVIVTRGNDVSGPWKLPVVIPSSKYTRHVLYYKAMNNASTATVHFPPDSTWVSVTVFSKEGVQSQAFANALSKISLEEGKKLLSRLPNLRTVFVDKEGQRTFIQ